MKCIYSIVINLILSISFNLALATTPSVPNVVAATVPPIAAEIKKDSKPLEHKCSICGMTFKLNPKASFTADKAGKEIHFCSFSCAYRFHSTYPKLGIRVPDYLTGETIDASKAFFLARSKKLLSELEFDMPPTIAGFATRENADKVQQRLGDGKILQGFDAVINEYN